MTAPHPDPAAAFRHLRRALIVRRVRGLDPVLAVELSAIGALVALGVFWRARPALDAIARAGGPAAALRALALALAGAAALGGLAAGADAARRRRLVPPGPEWGALPLPPAAVEAQSAWEARLHALWVLPLPLGTLAAAAGLVPGWWLGIAAALFAAGLRLAAELATRLARALVPLRAARGRAVRPLPAARWGPGLSAALLRRDLARTLRRTPARPRAAAWLALVALALAPWALPLRPAAAAAFSAALALAAAASLSDWMIALSAGDPYPLLAALPLSARRIWGLRIALVAAAALALCLPLAIASRTLDPAARGQLVAGLACATLLVGGLGVTYGVTLFPRVATAQRLVLLWLGIAAGASLAFPLAGWLVLAAALAHALRRLPGRPTLAAPRAAEA